MVALRGSSHPSVAYRAARFACLLAIVLLALVVGVGVGFRAAGARPVEIRHVPVPVRDTLAVWPSASMTVTPRTGAERHSEPAPRPRRQPTIALTLPSRSLTGRIIGRASEPFRTSGRTIAGSAVWHATGRDGLVGAAGPLLREWLGSGWRGMTVTVCRGRCIQVRLTDWCRCRDGRRLVDLSDEAFARLAPLSRGILGVKVTR
jgi:hypothetical protein